MKKVINITIGGMVFTVEEDAYKKLSDYLDAIKAHFTKDKDGDEIIEDIEASIAEKFSKRKNKNAAVTGKDVAAVMEQMGSLKDFKKLSEEEDDDAETDDSSEEGGKKLYRDPDDNIIAGVASGLAAYFGIDALLIRVLFVISIFFGGFGIMLYLLLWLVIPLAESRSQKLEMKGERITLHEIEKSVKKEIHRLKKKDLSALKKFGSELGELILVLLKALQKIIGAAFMLTGIAGVFILSFALTWQLSGGDIPDTNLTLNDFIVVTETMYWVFVLSVYVLMVVPLILAFLLGLGMMKNVSVIRGGEFVLLLVLWFGALGLTGSVVFENLPLIETRFEEIDEHYEFEQDEYFYIDEVRDFEEPKAPAMPF
ncbi:MAG: PspC domain-containing protein [Patescibacteria group bacterium]